MNIKHIFYIDKWDNIYFNHGTLTIADNENIVELHGADVAKKVSDAYDDTLDDRGKSDKAIKLLKDISADEQDRVFNNIWDEPSYQKLEKENLRQQNIIDRLKETIEQLENENDALRARR